MRKLLVCLTSFLLWPLALMAVYNRPEIQSVTPNSFTQINPRTSPNTMETLTISGIRIAPKADSRFGGQSRRIKVLFGNTESGQVEVPTFETSTEGNEETITVHFSANKWLKKPGPLQIVVKVEEMASLAYNVSVIPRPTTSPTLFDVTPNSFSISSELKGDTDLEAYYHVVVKGSDFDAESQMTLTIGGYNALFHNLKVKEGTFETDIPHELWNKTGTFSIILFGSNGGSNALLFEVTKNAPTEDIDNPGAGAGAGTNTDLNTGTKTKTETQP
jgi:hypothetical protein